MFLYDMVLNNGKELVCYTDNLNEALRMYLKDDIFIVRENKKVGMNTYISKDRVSHIRFSQKNDSADAI